MPAVISLREVVDGIESQMDESASYLDPDTGEIVLVTDEEQRLVEEGREDEAPDWQREGLPKVREILESRRFLRLPSKYDVHEWQIMRNFSSAQKNERVREELMDAIHGAGAFRLFKKTLRLLDLEDAWYQFREQALQKIARDWLEAHHLPYK
jgi:hypothetical protein